jgi:hypothetical protein
MPEMVRRVCSECGQFAWHNPCANKERVNGRCTYCGHPPNGNTGTDKRALNEAIRARQVNRARLLRQSQ